MKPRTWRILMASIVGASIGIPLGIGSYTLHYSKAFSYLSDNPEVCANCHIMRQQLKDWTAGSHHHIAACNDCHTPHEFFGKYWTKAMNGYHHSVAFTLGGFAEPIRIKPNSLNITEANCRRCHFRIADTHDQSKPKSEFSHCVRCHQSIAH